MYLVPFTRLIKLYHKQYIEVFDFFSVHLNPKFLVVSSFNFLLLPETKDSDGDGEVVKLSILVFL